MYRPVLLLLISLLLSACAPPYAQYDVENIRNLWDDDIAAFDAMNRQPLPADPILFYGSSSIRLWENIEEDLSPFSVVRRGYGGASLHDAAYYAKRVLSPIDYRALVLFVGNDIWGKPTDKSPAQMKALLDYIVKTSRNLRPDAPVFLIEVTHVPARAHLMKQWDAANAMLKKYAAQRSYVHFIPTRDLYVDADNRIREDLFREDRIHQNEAGYAIWKTRIKEEIGRELY